MNNSQLILKQGLANPQKQLKDLQNESLERPSDEQRQQNLKQTQNQIDSILGKRINNQDQLRIQHNDLKYVKYIPQTLNGAKQQRIIQIKDTQEDPLEPARFKHKKIPGGPSSPPPQVNRSPPRLLTQQDQRDFKIPPCISNWKNAKGYTIPLHMRLQADGRNLQDTSINEKFAQFADSLYAVEKQAREEINQRSKIQEAIKIAMQQKKEQKIRDIAAQAIKEKNNLKIQKDIKGTQEEDEDVRERDAMRYERKREIERERRLEVAGKKKQKINRDSERDISEKIALGQAQPNTKDMMFDQRLFNQTSGLEQGFGEDDDYNIFDKPLFTDRTAASIYKNIKEVPDETPTNDNVKKVLNQQPQKNFEGIDYNKGARTKPVEFEKTKLDNDQEWLGQTGLQSYKRQKLN